MSKATSSITTSRRGVLTLVGAAPIALAGVAVPAAMPVPKIAVGPVSRDTVVGLIDATLRHWAVDEENEGQAFGVLTEMIGSHTISQAVALAEANCRFYNAEHISLDNEQHEAFGAVDMALHAFIFQGAAATAQDAIARILHGMRDENGYENWHDADAFTENAIGDLERILAEGTAWRNDSPRATFTGWVTSRQVLPSEAEFLPERVEAREQAKAAEEANEARMQQEAEARAAKIRATMPANRDELIARYDALSPERQEEFRYFAELMLKVGNGGAA